MSAENYESLCDHEKRIKELEAKLREMELQVDMLNRHVQRYSK